MQRKSAIINAGESKYIAYLWEDNGYFYKIKNLGKSFGDSFEIISLFGEVIKGKIKGKEIVGQCHFFNEFCFVIKSHGKEIEKGYSLNYPKTKVIKEKQSSDNKTKQEEIDNKTKKEEIDNKSKQEEGEKIVERQSSESIIKQQLSESIIESQSGNNIKEQDSFDKMQQEQLGFEGEIATTNYFEKVVNGEASLSATEFLKEKSKEKEKQAFYMELKPQLDKLFNTFPKDEYLTEVIPSSKWVKIEYDNTGKSYSVGVITDGEDVVYIGYGIRSVFTKSPPTSVKSVAQWMPLSFEDVKGEGYWMIYQTASTGENV